MIVVRYFGGILLGTSGLINAYKKSTNEVLANSLIVDKIILNEIEIKFDYQAMNDLMMVLKEFELVIKASDFDLTCKAYISVRKDLTAVVLDKLDKIDKLKAQIVTQPT